MHWDQQVPMTPDMCTNSLVSDVGSLSFYQQHLSFIMLQICIQPSACILASERSSTVAWLLTFDCRAGMRSNPGGRHSPWPSWPSQRLELICCRLHSSLLHQTAWQTHTQKHTRCKSFPKQSCIFLLINLMIFLVWWRYRNNKQHF